MSISRRASAVCAAAVCALLVLSCVIASAAKKPSNRVYVPAHILKGSTVTKGRVFYRTTLPENMLAGIRLGRPAKEVLYKWGNPTRITVGVVQAPAESGTAPTSDLGPSYTPPGGGSIESLTRGLGAMLPGGQLPGLPGIGSPSQNLPALPQQQQQNVPMLTEEEVTWTYDLRNGITLEFIITDGLVTQITVGGEGPWALSKTRTGIQLGDTYKLVLWVCGYPEYQKYVGRFLRVSYVNKSRALYTFLNKRLVGVTIAIVPEELN